MYVDQGFLSIYQFARACIFNLDLAFFLRSWEFGKFDLDFRIGLGIYERVERASLDMQFSLLVVLATASVVLGAAIPSMFIPSWLCPLLVFHETAVLELMFSQRL